ncbi:MAG: tetratricopeptide repeat protein [Bacteroidales bacterium]|jgi:tetratricopeptide (TPR) repeat protein
MKKLTYLFVVIFLTSAAGLKAQTAEGTPDANFSIYKSKLRKSEENLTDEKKNAKPKFWEDRAELMMDIFELHREHIGQGTQKVHVKLLYGDPIEVESWQGEDGSSYEKYKFEKINILFKDDVLESFEEVDVLYDQPLPEARRSLEKTQELDVNNKMDKKVKEDYDRLKQLFERLAIEEFFSEEYAASFKAFKAIREINEKPIMEGLVDTTLIYYAGMAASRAELTDEAIEYYELARSYDYPEPDLYVFLRNKYWESGDTAKGLEVLVAGFEKFPDNQSILIELINYYLVAGKSQEALDYLAIAQEDDPTNLSYIFAEGTLLDKQGKTEEALELYQKCIDMDPEYFNAYYNIGVMYFNKAVEMYKEANSIADPVEYGNAKDKADEVLKKSLPFMEKANEIAEANTDWPKEYKEKNVTETLETLKTLYYRLQMTDKYEEAKAQLGEE